MSVNRMIQKAYNLINNKRIEYLGGDIYNVIGDHGTYAVVYNYNGTVSCNCAGFRRRARCSHSFAILILNKSKKTGY